MPPRPRVSLAGLRPQSRCATPLDRGGERGRQTPSSLLAASLGLLPCLLAGSAVAATPPQAASGAAALLKPSSVAPVPCAAPQPGRYVVMGDGEAQSEPVARILLETWKPDGSISGVRLERRGRVYREELYSGSYRQLSLCRAGISRTYNGASSSSQAVLDPAGRPRYSLGTLPDVVVVSRWFQQAGGACNAGLLDGTVLSMQRGRSWKDGRWRPNAVIQNERWRGGSVQGIAIASYGPRIEETTYSGTIRVTPDCLATVEEKDSLDVPFNYRAVVLADGSGYLYLQTDPDDLSVGYLEHQRARAGAAAQR